MNKNLKIVVIIVALTTFASCASSGSHQAIAPVSERLSYFDKAMVKVTTRIDDAQSAVSTVQQQVMQALQPRFVAAQEGGKVWPGTLELDLEITQFNRVSSGSRMMLGGLAGKDLIVVSGTLTNLVTKKQIGSFTAQGENSGGGGIQIGDPGVFRAATVLANEISDYVTKENM